MSSKNSSKNKVNRNVFKTVEEIQQEKERLDQIEKNLIVKKRMQAIKSVFCGDCDHPLDLNPEDYIEDVLYSLEVVCPSCERINRLNIEHDGADSNVKISVGDYTWQSYVPGRFTQKMVDAWFKDQLNKIRANESMLSNEMQLLMLKLALDTK